MSNAQEHHNEENQSLIKTPKQLIIVIALSIIVPIVIIIMLANYVAGGTSSAPGSDALTPQSIDARIAPVAGFAIVNADAPREVLTGDAVYTQVCAACHATGVAGAPKIGDQAAWGPLLAKGFEELVHSVINGKGAMPPKGGATQLSDFEIQRAVVYLTSEGGGSFPEPEAPAEEGEAAEAATAEAAPAAAAPAADAAPASAAAPAAEPTPAAENAAATATAELDPNTVGKKIYESACFACHGTGVAGAPKIGDKEAWAPYVATGMDTMLQVSITGKGAMPPRGTAMTASDDELRAAIQYMISQ